jgi:hypothetical protein
VDGSLSSKQKAKLKAGNTLNPNLAAFQEALRNTRAAINLGNHVPAGLISCNT